jgi:general secretion pathway protein A
MYCDYWNLTKPPFDNVPDASMYVDCHESMENVISETIFAIKEGNECLTVIVGEVGLGKTLSLRVIIDSLEPEKYKVALITNPALSFVQLLREIIGQITGKQCVIKNKVDLQEVFNRLLFETADQGKKIVIVIDEANVLSPSNLDDLRLLTNMQDDERNLFTLLLVGQMEFAKTLEHPKRANLFQRIGTYGHIEKLPSQESVRTYIESRLKIAGSQRMLFDDDAIPVIWEFSEHGVPRLINKLCKLCLKAGETNEFASISGEVASAIADRFQKLSKTSLQKRKSSGSADSEATEEVIEKPAKTPRASVPKKETPKVKAPPAPVPPPSPREEVRPVQPRMLMPEEPPARPAPPPPREEVRPVQPRVLMPEEPPARPVPPPMEEVRPFQPRMVAPEEPPFTKPNSLQMEEAKTVQPKAVPLAKPSANYVPTPGVPLSKTSATPVAPQREARAVENEPEEQPVQAENEVYEDVIIGQQKIQLAIPANVIRQAQSKSSETKNKLAGYWSAQILKGNPNIMHSSFSDPVAMWFEVKNVILKKFNSPLN